MKTYQVNLTMGQMELLTVYDQILDGGKSYWAKVGALTPEMVAKHILLAVTKSVDLTYAHAEGFEAHFFNPRRTFPLVVTERDVYDWISAQPAQATEKI